LSEIIAFSFILMRRIEADSWSVD